MKTRRRDFVKLGCAFALVPAGTRGCATRPARTPTAPAAALPPVPRDTQPAVTTLNDIHSQLNATRVAAVTRPSSVDELRAAILGARDAGRSVSVAGGRHSMGGQQFGTDTLNLDMRGMSRVLAFDRERGTVEVEAGIEWPELLHYLWDAQADEPEQWGIVQKQTATDQLIHSIRRVHRGEMCLDSRTTAAVVLGMCGPAPVSPPELRSLAPSRGRMGALLSQRQMEVVHMTTQGFKNSDIAAKLALSEQTVKNHMHNIFERLEVTDRLELALLYVSEQLQTSRV